MEKHGDRMHSPRQRNPKGGVSRGAHEEVLQGNGEMPRSIYPMTKNLNHHRSGGHRSSAGGRVCEY